MDNTNIIHNLEDIQARKAQLHETIGKQGEKVTALWHDLVTVKQTNDRGEMLSGLLSKGVMAFDVVLMITKLYRRYGSLFKRKKRR